MSPPLILVDMHGHNLGPFQYTNSRIDRKIIK